jgi:hypothetical protein
MYIVGLVSRVSSVGIATCFGLDGPGIRTQVGGARFSHCSRPLSEHTQRPVRGLRGKAAGAWR